jgi:hypothetical protein
MNSTVSQNVAAWRGVLSSRMPYYGHRNWIVVVDAAYPAQTGKGVETVLCDDPQIEVVKGVIEALSAAPHVRPIVYVDRELEVVPEGDAPGISEYRKQLVELLGTAGRKAILHEKLIERLADASKTFKVLMLKTKLSLPYTSVFFQLECGYWSASAEKRLRKALGK